MQNWGIGRDLSGGGGLDLSFEYAGFDHVASFDILDICGASLQQNRPHGRFFVVQRGMLQKQIGQHAGGGVLMNQTSHDLDYAVLRWWAIRLRFLR